MSELSPTSLEVWSSYCRIVEDYGPPRLALAAALRAAVDEVISSVPPPCADYDEYAQGFLGAHVKYRGQLLEIADELEAHKSPSLTSHEQKQN